MSDMVLMWGIAVLLPVTAWMRCSLAAKKGMPLTPGAKLQTWLFPAAYLIAVLLLQFGVADILIPVLLLGVLEELLFSMARRRRMMDPNKTSEPDSAAKKH